MSRKRDSYQSVAPRELLGSAPNTSSDRSSHAFQQTRLLSKTSRTSRAPEDCPLQPFLFCLFCFCWLPLSPKHVIDLTTRGPLHMPLYLASFAELTSGHLSCWRILPQEALPTKPLIGHPNTTWLLYSSDLLTGHLICVAFPGPDFQIHSTRINDPVGYLTRCPRA